MKKMVAVALLPFLLVSCAAPMHQQGPRDLAVADGLPSDRQASEAVSRDQAECIAGTGGGHVGADSSRE